jgi:hypothetical protein
MVRTLVFYDVAGREARMRLEHLLSAAGFTHLVPGVRRSPRPLAQHRGLSAGIRRRLRGAAYRVLLVDLRARSITRSVWLSGAREDPS